MSQGQTIPDFRVPEEHRAGLEYELSKSKGRLVSGDWDMPPADIADDIARIAERSGKK